MTFANHIGLIEPFTCMALFSLSGNVATDMTTPGLRRSSFDVCFAFLDLNPTPQDIYRGLSDVSHASMGKSIN